MGKIKLVNKCELTGYMGSRPSLLTGTCEGGPSETTEA